MPSGSGAQCYSSLVSSDQTSWCVCVCVCSRGHIKLPSNCNAYEIRRRNNPIKTQEDVARVYPNSEYSQGYHGVTWNAAANANRDSCIHSAVQRLWNCNFAVLKSCAFVNDCVVQNFDFSCFQQIVFCLGLSLCNPFVDCCGGKVG